METKQFNELAKQLAEMVLAKACQPIKTNTAYSWQEFTPLTPKEEESLEPGVTVKGTIYESGTVELSVRIDAKTFGGVEKVKEAFNTLRAKNLVLCALEKKLESEEAANQADQLLTEAAGYMSIPVADIEKIVVTESDEAKQ